VTVSPASPVFEKGMGGGVIKLIFFLFGYFLCYSFMRLLMRVRVFAASPG